MVKRILIICGFWVLGLFTVMAISTPKPPNFRNSVPRPINQSIEKSIQITPVKHDDTVWLPANMMCPQWAQMAIDVGWLETDLQKIDAVMHRESRCFSTSHYSKDPHGGSYGLMQINAFWCKPSRWYPSGYLQSFGVLTNCKQLFHPRTNLIAARVIWQYSHTQYGDGWLPWRP